MAARPTLVLLHGGPGADHSFFKPDFAAMTHAAQVVNLDQRGSGRSEHGDPGGWTWERWADDVAGFCHALDIEAPLLVGTSSARHISSGVTDISSRVTDSRPESSALSDKNA